MKHLQQSCYTAPVVMLFVLGCTIAPGVKTRPGEGWSDYLSTLSGCQEAEWPELAHVAGLMRDRIHHMMSTIAAYSL